LAELAVRAPLGGAVLHSETAGSMIDRMSVMGLKIFHMREQTRSVDAGAGQIARCRATLAQLMAQRADLCACFDHLLRETRAGRAYFKVCRQFTLHDDPAFAPALYASACLSLPA
jgi:hypothetical protein